MTPEQRADIERRDRSAVHGDDDSPEYMQAVNDRHALLDALVMAEQRANAYHDAKTLEYKVAVLQEHLRGADELIAELEDTVREGESEIARLRKTLSGLLRAALRELSNDADELGDYTS